jgi:signal peptidase II
MEIMQRSRVWMTFVGIAGIVAVDQLTKWTAERRLSAQIVPVWDGFVRLTLARNSGGAFGLFAEQGEWLAWLTLGVVVAIVAVLWRGRARSLRFHLGLIAVAGGALGNLVDRARLGHVVDFIDVGISPTLRWPTFNLADVSIVVGTGLLLWHLLTRAQETHP